MERIKADWSNYLLEMENEYQATRANILGEQAKTLKPADVKKGTKLRTHLWCLPPNSTN